MSSAASAACVGSYTRTALLSGRRRALAAAWTSSAVIFQDALDGGQRELGVAEQDGVPAEFVGAARDRTEPVEPLALQLGLRALHLLGRGALGGEAGQFLVDGALDVRAPRHRPTS